MRRRIVHRRTVFISSKDAGEVEAEAVNTVIDGPVTQAFQDQLLNDRMVAVQSVSTAAEIVVISVRRQHVVNVIVESLETEGRSLLVALCGMVEYNVEDDFNPVCMKFTDQCLELCTFSVVLVGRRVAAVRSKKAHSIVAG